MALYLRSAIPEIPYFIPDKADYPDDETPKSKTIYPIAGFAQVGGHVSHPGCGENNSALTVFWSNFLSHAHHRWNSGTIDVFACNTQWWRDSGYVPYWHFARPSAETWYGANGPYLLHETRPEPGSTELVGYVESDELDYLKISRKVPSHQAEVQREVYGFGPVIITVDSLAARSAQSLNLHWTMAPDKGSVAGQNPNSYFFSSKALPVKMYTRFLSTTDLTLKAVSGAQDSVLGWTELNSQMQQSMTFNLQNVPALSSQMVNVSILMPGQAEQCEPAIKAEKIHQSGQQFSL